MKPGDKVLCIDDTNYPRKYWLLQKPKMGEIYTVRRFQQASDGEGLILNEIFGGLHPTLKEEESWRKQRFILWNPEEEVIEEKNYSEVKNNL